MNTQRPEIFIKFISALTNSLHLSVSIKCYNNLKNRSEWQEVWPDNRGHLFPSLICIKSAGVTVTLLWSVFTFCRSHTEVPDIYCGFSLFCMKPPTGKVATLQSFTFSTSFARGFFTSRLVYGDTINILATTAKFSFTGVSFLDEQQVRFYCQATVNLRRLLWGFFYSYNWQLKNKYSQINVMWLSPQVCGTEETTFNSLTTVKK